MARKKRTTATRSSPSPDASPNPSPNPNLAGESESHRRRQGKKQKGQSSCSEIALGASSAELGGGDNPKSQTTTRQGYLENELQAKRKRRKGSPLAKQRRSLEGKGPQSNAPGYEEMSSDTEHMSNKKSSKKVEKKDQEGSGSPQKASLAYPWLWCVNRKCLWYLSWHNFQRRRPKRSRVILCKRVSKSTKKIKTADSNYLENESHESSSKCDKMVKPARLGIRPLLVDIITAENKRFKDYHKPVEALPSWRPPIPRENDILLLNRVETNGEGRVRLEWNGGDALVEVFDIKVDLRGRTKTFGKIHGTITLDCMVYQIALFNRDKESAVMIQDKGSLPLKGFDIAPLGYDPMGFIVDLKIDDDELCDELLLWDPCYNRINEWLLYTLKGKNGFVHVTYTVMEHSWLADLDVKLIKLPKETGSKIYGDIVVYTNDMPYLTYFVFSKRSDEYSTVKPLDSLELCRSLFVCDRGSSLVVKVDLWDSDTKELLASGALLFPPEYYGESVGAVSDPCGVQVQVKVNWGRYLIHSKTRKAL